MARRRNRIFLSNLSSQAASELKLMVAELTGETRGQASEANKTSRWSPRFEACGKNRMALGIRLS
jgi:hypothetical protein